MPAGTIGNRRADRASGLGILLLAVAASLVGQSPAPGQAPPASPNAVAVADAAQAQASADTGKKPHDSSFVIGNDDLLTINVWKEQDLSREIPVRSDGKISLPLAGEVQAAGRTPQQLEEDIAAKLRNYITDPEVTVMVKEINSQKVNVLGQVAKPGSYPLALAGTVLDAIAAAGGFRDFAKQKGIYILRKTADGGESRIAFNYKDYVKGKNPNQNIKLEPHDTVVVP
jgi:polysaccharide export outer membrane protein